MATLGQNGTGFQLIARLRGVFAFVTYVIKESDTTWGVWNDVPPASAPLTRVSGPFPILAGQRFPFGLSVFPD